MKFENTQVFGIENALIGMRLPMNRSFQEAKDKSDTIGEDLGTNDLVVCEKLINADKLYNSQPNSKFLRMIHVQVCVTAPAYIFHEIDTYKVGVTRNSSSLMHKGVSKEFTLDDFEIDNRDSVRLELDSGNIKTVTGQFWKTTLDSLNWYRAEYLKNKDMNIFRALRQAIPMSFLYTSMLDLNYAALRTMIQQRKYHRLKEWREDFINWCKTLPYAKFLLFTEE